MKTAMEAVIETGGKQYPVAVGGIAVVEKLAGEVGDTVVFDRVLMAKKDGETLAGTPFLAGAKVRAKVVEHLRDKKIRIFKLRRRKNSKRQQGHRQHCTRVRFEGVDLQ